MLSHRRAANDPEMMHEETHDPQNMLSRGQRILTDQFDEPA